MNKKLNTILKIIAIFAAGAIVGGLIVAYKASTLFEGLHEATALFTLADQIEEGDYIYKNATPPIAIHKLQHILYLMESYEKAGIRVAPSPISGFWDKGVIFGRLGKLYKKENNEKEAKEYLTKAQSNFEQYGWKLKDEEEVLTAITMLDTQKMSQVLQSIGQYTRKKK
jgi:predicted HTH transcriptional regulator